MYKVKMLNEYQIKELLKHDGFEPENFYKDELVEFLNISIKDNKKIYQQRDRVLKQIANFCNECSSKDCCSEENCVLYRIEQILNGKGE